MAKYNPGNERIKRRYFVYMKEAVRQSEDSVDNAAAAIARFEAYTGQRDFKAFHVDQAVGFKRDLARRPGQVSGKPLSKEAEHGTGVGLQNVRQRLDARYGAAATSRFGPRADGGYEAQLVLPLEIENGSSAA